LKLEEDIVDDSLVTEDDLQTVLSGALKIFVLPLYHPNH